MNAPSSAERERRAREWLRLDVGDPERNAEFEAAKQRLRLHEEDALALIAVGEFRALRGIIESVDNPERLLILLSRYFAASGDDALARRLWPRVVAALGAGGRGDAETLRGMSRVAEAIGERAVASDLAHVARSRSAVGDAQPADGFIVQMISAVIGYEPDASKGRLVLRPRIMPGMQRMTVENIHIGDALIDMTYNAPDGAARFEIVQTAGAYPVRLIFEPSFQQLIATVTVDGVAARLDMRPDDDRVIVPLQIMLDERRVIEMRIAAGNGG